MAESWSQPIENGHSNGVTVCDGSTRKAMSFSFASTSANGPLQLTAPPPGTVTQ
jgi:hypothetical protein